MSISVSPGRFLATYTTRLYYVNSKTRATIGSFLSVLLSLSAYQIAISLSLSLVVIKRARISAITFVRTASYSPSERTTWQQEFSFFFREKEKGPSRAYETRKNRKL